MAQPVDRAPRGVEDTPPGWSWSWIVAADFIEVGAAPCGCLRAEHGGLDLPRGIGLPADPAADQPPLLTQPVAVLHDSTVCADGLDAAHCDAKLATFLGFGVPEGAAVVAITREQLAAALAGSAPTAFQQGIAEAEQLFDAVRTRCTAAEYDSVLGEVAAYLGDSAAVMERLRAALDAVADRPSGVARKLQAQQATAAAAGQTEEAAELAQLVARVTESDRAAAVRLLTAPAAPTEPVAPAATASPPIGTVGGGAPTPEAVRLTEAGYTLGGPFIHDLPPGISAVWGHGDDVLWAEGESCILAGPQGVGKSTMAGLLVLGMITGEPVLGFPVAKRGRILYLAMDRPRQIARALRRQLGQIDRATLDEHLVVWEGPPAGDLAKDPDRLLAMMMLANAQVVVVDSLKDAAIGLNDDQVGAGWNRARQKVLQAGGEIVELHHQRKSNGDASSKIERLYGSIWISAGAGSVLLLDGEPGDPLIKMTHLKQPANEVGPLTLLHDGATGAMAIHEEADVVVLAEEAFRKFGGGGVVVNAAAQAIFETTTPTANEVEKARRKLEAAVKNGRLRRNGKHATSGATFYAPVTPTAGG
jgi:hypothetical protein